VEQFNEEGLGDADPGAGPSLSLAPLRRNKPPNERFMKVHSEVEISLSFHFREPSTSSFCSPGRLIRFFAFPFFSPSPEPAALVLPDSFRFRMSSWQIAVPSDFSFLSKEVFFFLLPKTIFFSPLSLSRVEEGVLDAAAED